MHDKKNYPSKEAYVLYKRPPLELWQRGRERVSERKKEERRERSKKKTRKRNIPHRTNTQILHHQAVIAFHGAMHQWNNLPCSPPIVYVLEGVGVYKV